MSGHGNRHRPATAAAARPKVSTCITRVRVDAGRSSVRSAVWPWATLIWPVATASAMRSASHSLCRSFSPGDNRITRVVSVLPRGLAGSLKLRIRPVGLDQGSHSRSRRWARATIAPSRR